MKSYLIHFIRHGTSEGNLEGKYIGRTDSPLAEQSMKKLVELKTKYEYPTAQAYFSSSASRCVDTLKILYPQAKAAILPGLEECNFGDWEGKTAEQLKKSDPEFAKWIENGQQVAPPNGESGIQFMQRVCAAFENLVESMMRSGTTSAVVVTHGGVIMTILAAYGLPKAQFYEWMCEGGCGYSLRITQGLWMRSMVAEVYETLPRDGEKAAPVDHSVIDLAREAANRAYGKSEEKE